MRIFHINCDYIFTTLHQKMFEELRKQGVDGTVFVPIRKGAEGLINPISGVDVVKCFSDLDRFLFYVKQKKLFGAIKEKYVFKDYDIIHAYTLFTDGNCAYKLYKEYGIPYVVAVRNTDVNLFFKRRIFLRKRGIQILSNASRVFFLSESYKKQVMEKYVPKRKRDDIEKKSVVIPNGIDDFWHDNLNTSNREKAVDRINNRTIKLLYVGGINKNKNLGLTLDAINLLRNEGWNIEYTVVGRIEDEDLYNILISQNGTRYFKPEKKENLIDIYRDNDIFVMPSHTETFGLVYAEAMSQGLPIIYTRGQGFDKQFEEGVVGYSVSDADASELADVIERITRGYQELSSNCLEKVKKFNWNDIVNQYIEIYKSIL